MTLDEYKAKFSSMTAENFATTSVSILDELGKDLAAKEAADKKIGEQETQIKSLQEQSMQLFLRVTGETPKAAEAEETKPDWRNMRGMDAIDAFMKSKEGESNG